MQSGFCGTPQVLTPQSASAHGRVPVSETDDRCSRTA